ncbi:uncharacterized protein EAF02_011184 [Botrytis sinoallii]|uniref:uncharacterized protein n=1 Tax=Botrytis sinoallii TaxID=1463999 RepID=UPI0019018B9D|nr:uncharacterized protein EAF02_011184 [Botrytis sinoallii]KAF7857817.1 hypothetical protein EAF02_011184 [Botrytis sinoallii]
MEAGNTSHIENLSNSELIQGDRNNAFAELLISLSSDSDDCTYKINDDGREIFLDLALIHWAAGFSKPSIINLLLEYGVKVDEKIPIIGGTALHLASRFGSKNNIDILLSQKLDINQKYHVGATPLHLASRYGKEENVEYLLDEGADYSQFNNYNNMAIHHAAMFGELETLKILYRRGSHRYINEPNCYLNAPLHLASMFGNTNVAEWLLEKGAAIYQPGTGGDTPLHMATSRGHVEIVRQLLNNGADIHKKNDNSYSAILIASENANIEIFRMLRGSGAFLLDVGARDHGTCYHRVIMCFRKFSSDHDEIIKFLVGDGVDINQANANGHSPLFLACINQKLEHAQCLLKYGADVYQMGSRKNGTPLIEACCIPASRIVELLLQHNADTAIKNSHGMTALACAVYFNHLEHVKLLIKIGANVICSDRRGITPLHTAVLQKKSIAIALEILAAEPYYPKSPSAKYPHMGSTSEILEIETVLLQGFESSEYETLEQLHIIMYWAVSNGAKDLANRCIDHDRRVLRWTREGATWLHITSKSGMVEIAQLLLGRMTMQSDARDQPLGLAAVALIIQQNSRGDSPLAIAIEKGHDQLEDFFWSQIKQLQITEENLIDSHPDIAAQILEFLARHEEPGNEEILKGFLRSGGKRDVKDSEGFTALQWAVCRSQEVIVWWLLSKGGYSSDKINSALKLIIENSDKKSETIKGLLRTPPTTLDHVSNPNKKHKRKFPKSANSNNFTNQMGSIVDILSGPEPKRIKHATPSVKELIYDIGPEDIMRKAGDLSERYLALLKETQKKDCGASSNRIGVQTKYSPSLDSTSPQHEKIGDETPSSGNLRELDLRWIHLPVNEDLVSRLSSDSGRSEREHMAIMKHFNKSWTELAAGAERYYMKPQFLRKQEDTHYDPVNGNNGDQAPRESTAGACAALYMPYLDIGTFDRKIDKSSNTKSSTLLDESINERNSREIKHEPITLDQYYYPTIDDTSTRDNDQVLQKNTHGEPALDLDYRQKYCYRFRIPSLNKRKFGETPEQISKVDRDPPEILLQNALDNILHGDTKSQFERAKTVDSLMELLLGVASGLFMKRFVPVSGQIYKEPIEIFRESIRDVAEKESSLFQEFLRGLQEAKPREQKSLEPEQKKEQPSSEDSDSKPPDRPMPLNRYHVISSETELLNMIRDIRDELHMLRSLAEDQEVVWKQAFASSNLMHFKAYSPTNVKKDLDAMLSEADKTEGYINTLLDLRQAEFGRLQAYDSARQSNSIFVFTIMTIVFLPLSFLTSLFALNVSDFPHEGDNVQYKGWWIFPIIFGVTALISIPAIIFAWKVNAFSSFRPRNNISSESSKHTDVIKRVRNIARRRGRKSYDAEA